MNGANASFTLRARQRGPHVAARMRGWAFGLALGAALACLAGPAHATEVGTRRPLGLGFAFGEPISLTGKYFLGPENAVDFGLSFWNWDRGCAVRDGTNRCRGYGYLGFFGDYLWYYTLAIGTAKLDWHFGPGARLWVGDNYYDENVALAARMPVGIDLTFDKPEFIEIYAEVGPVLYVVPRADLDPEGAIGVRFYF